MELLGRSFSLLNAADQSRCASISSAFLVGGHRRDIGEVYKLDAHGYNSHASAGDLSKS